MLTTLVENNLFELLNLLQQLKTEEYNQSHIELSNSSIGEHVRHIIEMYQCLLDSYDKEFVNYDLRKRDILIQTKIEEAEKHITFLLKAIKKANKKLILKQGENDNLLAIETNYDRELLYNLEHSIHHQALIKVVLSKFKHIKVANNFGVARSTIEYRIQCAQ